MGEALERERGEHRATKTAAVVVKKQKRDLERQMFEMKRLIDQVKAFKPEAIAREMKAMDNALLELRTTVQSFSATSTKDIANLGSRTAVNNLLKDAIATINGMRTQLRSVVRNCMHEQTGLYVGVGLGGSSPNVGATPPDPSTPLKSSPTVDPESPLGFSGVFALADRTKSELFPALPHTMSASLSESVEEMD